MNNSRLRHFEQPFRWSVKPPESGGFRSRFEPSGSMADGFRTDSSAFRKRDSHVPMNMNMNEKGRQTKLLAAIAVLAMVVCALAMVIPSGQVDAADATTNEAQIGDKAYPTFEEAVTAAIDGDTIEILADVSVDNCVTITGKTITIELNNHTIKTVNDADGKLIMVDAGSDVTINGPGILSNTSNAANGVLTVTADASLEINNITVDGKGYGIYAEGLKTGGQGATDAGLRDVSLTDDTEFATSLYVNKSTINTITMPAIGTNGNYGFEYIEINNSKLNTTEYTAMYIPSNAKVIVNSTTINASSGIDQRTGYLEINNSSITYTGAGQDKETGDGPTDFGVGISVIDATGYSKADAVTIVNNVTFKGNDEGAGDIVMGVPRNSSETTNVNEILNSEGTANRNGLLSVDGMEFSTKTDDTIGVSYTDNGNVTVGKANTLTATGNVTIGTGKTFTIGAEANIVVPSGNNLDLGDATVTAKDETWTLAVGAGSTVALPEGTTLPGTNAGDNVTVVGNDSKVTVGGKDAEGIVPSTQPSSIASQEDLEAALELGYQTIELTEEVEITKDIDMGSVAIIAEDDKLLNISEGVTVTFNGGSYVGPVTGNEVTADVALYGTFTLSGGSLIINDLAYNGDEDNEITVTSGKVVISGALNAELTINAGAGASGVIIDLNNLNITSAGKLILKGVTDDNTDISATGTVSVYGQIMADKKVTIDVSDGNTFRAYGGSVLQDTVTVSGDGTVNIDGAMHILTVNDDMASTNTYGQTQTVVIGSTLDIVSGTTITIQGQFVVNEGVTLTIQNGAKLVIDGATSVMDINGNVVVENGGIIEVKNSKAVDIAGEMDIYGTMTVNGGAVTVQENGVITVAVDGGLVVNMTGAADVKFDVKAGAAVDLLGGFNITTPITNAGTISLTGAVMNGTSNITMKNGGAVNVNSYTVGADDLTLTVTDGQNTIVFGDANTATDTGFSGVVITTASKKVNNVDTFTMSVSGSIGIANNTGDENAAIKASISGSKVAVTGDLTVGKGVTIANSATMAVSGTITATAGKFSNSGTIDVTGTITVLTTDALGATVNAAYYSLTPAAGSTTPATYVYTTFENAVQSGATTVYVGVGAGSVVSATETVTVPGTVKTLTVDGLLNIGAADNRDITVTIADGCNVTGTIEVYATLTFENNRNVRGTVNSDVVIDDEPARTYTNLYTALASGAETVTVARDVTLTSNIEIPQGVTLVVPAGTGITFNAGVTMTVNGAVQTAVDLTGPANGFDEKSASNTEDKKTARIVVNGKFMTSVTGKTAEAMYGQYKIAGAYYNISDSTGAFLVIEPVANAAANAANATNGIDIRGENTVNGVAFNGTKDKTLAVAINGKVSGDISLNYATLDINAQYDGTVSTATGAVELVNVTGIDIASVYRDVDGAAVESMTVSGQPAKANAEGAAPTMTIASGEVTVPAAGLNIGSQTANGVTTNVVALTVAEGAVMAVNGQLTAYDTTVYGELVSVNGGNVQLTEAFVFGTLTVAKDDATANVHAGTASITNLYIGLDKKYDNITAAAVNGTVSGVELMVVASQATVSQEFIDTFAESTAFNVEGSVWFTAYATSNTEPVKVDNVKVQDALFIGWAEKSDGEAMGTTDSNGVFTPTTIFNVGQYETLYAIIDYEIYTVTITADGGIGTVAIDGKVLVKTGNQFVISGLKAGTHTIDYIVNAGFEGTPTISVNGTAITGNSFTLSGTSDADRNVSISIYGTQPSTSTGGSITSGGDDGLGLTDILLIILVVLIVIMAVIVALRLMRS